MKTILKKIAEFQQECPVILKETEGFGYSYADLPSIFKVINPILKKHGLGFTQLLDDENLKSIVFDIETGEQVVSSVHIQQDVQLAKMNPFQVLGSAITYYRRYSLSAMLGIVTEKDTDAAGEVDKKPSYKPSKVDNKEDNGLPWMSEKQKNNFLDMIKEGKGSSVQASMDAYRMRRVYRDEINKALSEALTEAPEEPTNELAF